MLPENEIDELVNELDAANLLIEQQDSRIEFLIDTGEDAKALMKEQAIAKTKRDRFQNALQKQIAKFTAGQKAAASISKTKPIKR